MERKEVRWKQRFENLKRSFATLQKAIAIEQPSEVEKGGLIQFYEITFELAWKTMKDYLESEGFEVKSPRQTIKQAFQIELIEDGELWLTALEDRNLSAHLYDEETIDRIANTIRDSYFGVLRVLIGKLSVLE